MAGVIQMSRFQAATAMLVVALLSLTALPTDAAAKPGVGKCLWDALPQTSRDRYLETYATDGRTSANKFLTEGGPPAESRRLCGIAATRGLEAGEAFIAYASLIGSGDQLSQKFGVDPTVLTRAWRALPLADRARFAEDFVNLRTDKEAVAFRAEMIARATRGIRLPAGSGVDARVLLVSLAMLDRIEPLI